MTCFNARLRLRPLSERNGIDAILDSEALCSNIAGRGELVYRPNWGVYTVEGAKPCLNRHRAIGAIIACCSCTEHMEVLQDDCVRGPVLSRKAGPIKPIVNQSAT